MDILIVLGGWFLAGVFALAAWSKLAEPDATAQALRSFGVPASLARSGAWLLPLLEFAVALLVVVRSISTMVTRSPTCDAWLPL